MEAPQAGTTLYLDGLPLARIEPITDEDRAMIEETIAAMRRRRRVVLLGYGVYCAMLAALTLCYGLPHTLTTFINLLLLPVLMIFGFTDPNAKGLRESESKWVFEGSRPGFPAPLGLFSVERALFRRWRKPPLLALQPCGIVVEPGRRVQIGPAKFIEISTDSSGTDKLSERGLGEVRVALTRVFGQSGLSAILVAVSMLGFVLLLQRGFPPDLYRQSLLALCVVGLLDSIRTLWILGIRASRLIGTGRQPALIQISVLSPAYLATAHTSPEVEGALQNIEVVENGLLWTVDGRPAAWRIYGVEPVFIDGAALRLSVLAVARPNETALIEPKTNDTRPST